MLGEAGSGALTLDFGSGVSFNEAIAWTNGEDEVTVTSEDGEVTVWSVTTNEKEKQVWESTNSGGDKTTLDMSK